MRRFLVIDCQDTCMCYLIEFADPNCTYFAHESSLLFMESCTPEINEVVPGRFENLKGDSTVVSG